MTLPLRIFRSFDARYYEDDILSGPRAYPESYFQTLVEHGFNAVWLRGILRDLARSEVFPSLGREVAAHQDALAAVVQRAARFGVKVMLYLNEPLCLPADHAFWREHPEARGAAGKSTMDGWEDTFAFCTSSASVRQWLREMAERLFHDVPGLGGWFLISASEHHTHCLSHRGRKVGGRDVAPCPRCAARDASEVVAELITLLRDGTRAASSDAHCIAWNWTWTIYGPDPQPEILRRMPPDVSLLLDWERGGWRDHPVGRRIFVDEYSLAYIGPSERFQAGYAEARRLGLEVMAKLQVGATHELGTVPNLPLIDNLRLKLQRAEELGLAGILATWNFGNAFTLNTAVVGQFVRKAGDAGIAPAKGVDVGTAGGDQTPRPAGESREGMLELLAEYFPGCDAAAAAAAIGRFSAAMQYHPFSVPQLYHGPANYALAYPLTLEPLTGKPMGRSWMMDERGDDLARSLGPFTPQETIDSFAALAERWRAAAEAYAAALAPCPTPPAALEAGVARVIACCFASAANVYRVWQLRRDRPADAAERFSAILADEITNCRAALPLLEADGRLGFHAECQGVQFSAERVRAKLSDMRAMLSRETGPP